jgi:acyl carrier protein
VEERVVSIIRDQVGVPEERVTPDLLIIGEIDSPDHIELIMELEEEFDITIPLAEAARTTTVAEAIAYIKERLAC